MDSKLIRSIKTLITCIEISIASIKTLIRSIKTLIRVINFFTNEYSPQISVHKYFSVHIPLPVIPILLLNYTIVILNRVTIPNG
jgi:hypothetical protein